MFFNIEAEKGDFLPWSPEMDSVAIVNLVDAQCLKIASNMENLIEALCSQVYHSSHLCLIQCFKETTDTKKLETRLQISVHSQNIVPYILLYASC